MPWYPLESTLWRARLRISDLLRPRTGAFDTADLEAWTDFYVAEQEQERCSDIFEYARMLCRHGCPDVGNPLPNDDERHFLLHPGGFVSGEFDRCLRSAETDLDRQRGEQALSRLGLLSHLACPMLSARSYWAEEDLRFAMALSCMEGRWELAGARPSLVVVNAMRAGLLEPQIAAGVMAARLMAESHWHRPPWSMPTEPKPATESQDASAPAPEINLAGWRADRRGSSNAASAADGAVEKHDPDTPEQP